MQAPASFLLVTLTLAYGLQGINSAIVHLEPSADACLAWDAAQKVLPGLAQQQQPLQWRHGASFPARNADWGSTYSSTILHRAMNVNSRPVIHDVVTGLPTFLGEPLPSPCASGSATPRPVKVPFEEPLQGQWFRDQYGHPYFELAEGADTCQPKPQIRRLSAAAARRCLAGKKIAWIGDSVTRYQFLSLTNWLASGFYHHPYDDPSGRSLTNEKQWDSFTSFYAGVSSAIGSKSGCANFSSDCVREGPTFRDACLSSHEEWSTVIPVEPVVPFQPAVSQLNIKMRMHLVFAVPEFQTAGEDALRRLLQPPANETEALVAPWDIVVFNMGHWAIREWLQKQTNFSLALLYLFKLGRQLAPPNTILIYKTKNISKSEAPHYAALEASHAKMAQENGWLVYDINAVSLAGHRQEMDFHWDDLYHPFAYVYTQWNDLLLSQLCEV